MSSNPTTIPPTPRSHNDSINQGDRHADHSQIPGPRPRRPRLAAIATTASRSPTTTTRRTWGSAPCASSTRTASRRARASARTATATWRSSATCSRASSRTRTAWATSRRIPPGDVQRMSAGTRRAAQRVQPRARTQTAHFLQIWIEPNVRGIAPSYEQKHFADAEKRGRLRLVASPDGARRLGDDPRRCAPVRRAVRRRRARRAGARPGAQGLRARGARRARRQRPGLTARRRRSSSTAKRRSRWRTADDAEVLVFDLAA